jgi:hypothetical protein
MSRTLAFVFLALTPCLFSSCETQESQQVVALCEDCGIESGAAGCCDPNAERCADCKKIKGSAGCCK